MTSEKDIIQTLRRDMALIMRDNQRMQSDLKTKNETINSLINQNFAELKTLKEMHESVVGSLKTTYSKNVEDLTQKYNIFRASISSKMKDALDTHYNINSDRISLLMRHNRDLMAKLNTITESCNTNQKTMIKLRDEMHQVMAQNSDMRHKLSESQLQFEADVEKIKNLEVRVSALTSELSSMENARHTENTENLAKILVLDTELNTANVSLTSANKTVSQQSETISVLNSELDHAKTNYNDLHNKYLLILNDNSSKQSNLDEKILEILVLNSKVTEIEKRHASLETNRRDLNVRIAEYLQQIENLQTDLLASQKTVIQMKNEKDVITDEKYQYLRQIDDLKNRNHELEKSILEQIKTVQDNASRERDKLTTEYEQRNREMVSRYDKTIMTQRNEFVSDLTEKERNIEALTSHIKSFTDNQHVLLGDLERVKSLNEKMRLEKFDIDQRIGEVKTKCTQEIAEIKASHAREHDLLLQTYNNTIKKSQEVNDTLQLRLNQTIETLSISKTTIASLKEANQTLEGHLHDKETEDADVQERCSQLKGENNDLREKVDKLGEINKALMLKEKKQDALVKQLQTKCTKLINIAKKSQEQYRSGSGSGRSSLASSPQSLRRNTASDTFSETA